MKNNGKNTTPKAYFQALKLTGIPYYKWCRDKGFPLTTLHRSIKGAPLSPSNARRLSELTNGVLDFEALCFGQGAG